MDGYTDFLADLKKQGGPLLWITQKKEFLKNILPGKQLRTPEQIKQDVLQSPRLKHVIDQLLIKNNYKLNLNTAATDSSNQQQQQLKREDIELEAKLILDEMGHSFDLKYVRLLGYILIKVFAKIYQHIYYNSDIMANLEVLKNNPVVLLPLHRSYMDFLLVSILCFHKNIQLPAVAAGQDFLGLSFLSKAIRGCGAFFIRRSFGSDELYWAIFHQYVQEHLTNCDRPLEFFIEGTRSRTSKSLPPKQGMISTCIELYLKNRRVTDLYFVPISLTYERLLEEILYSNELLGIPKPKESVNGLVKARSILNQCYGSIFINFARPLSFRELLHVIEGPSLKNRLSHTLTPSFIFELNGQQMETIESFSYLALLEMLRNQVVQPISLIATCILLSTRSSSSLVATVNKSSSKQWMFQRAHQINLERLCYQIDQLKSVLVNLGVKVYWPVVNNQSNQISQCAINSKNDCNGSFEIDNLKHLVLDNIKIHANLFDLIETDARSVERNDEPRSPREFDAIITKARNYQFNSPSNKSKEECSCPFFIKLYQPHKRIVNENKTVSSIMDASLFESASLFIALCSYRNQLVHNLVRISFVCQSLMSVLTNHHHQQTSSTSDSEEAMMGLMEESKAFETYKLLVLLFNKEFIFNRGDELKDFNDTIRFLLHINVLKPSSSGDPANKYQLNKFSLKKFLFFVRIFRSVMNNYVEIYSTMLNACKSSKSSLYASIKYNQSTNQIEFQDEKKIIKSIQQIIFEKMINKINETSNDLESQQLSSFDMEILSLNLIQNSLTALKQFGILARYLNGSRDDSNNEMEADSEQTKQLTELKSASKYSYFINLTKLNDLNARLTYLIRTNALKLKFLKKLSRSESYSQIYDRAQMLLNSPEDSDDDDESIKLEKIFEMNFINKKSSAKL